MAPRFAKSHTSFFVANKLGAFFASDTIILETPVPKDTFVTYGNFAFFF
tara:strand:+ start:368 stop:514 length:147 start_codon:yes stop_codon:yes gene_type:complete